jgi:hypothetical protein
MRHSGRKVRACADGLGPLVSICVALTTAVTACLETVTVAFQYLFFFTTSHGIVDTSLSGDERAMSGHLFEIIGKTAGIGGIALGILLVLFRDIIRKLFPNLTRKQTYNLLVLMVSLVWMIALAGLASWTYVSAHPITNPGSPKETRQSSAERDVELVNLGYALSAYLVAQLTDPRGDHSQLTNLLEEQYASLHLTMPESKNLAGLKRSTESMLQGDRDSQCFYFGFSLAHVRELGGIILLHRGTDYEKRALPQIDDESRNVYERLESLGIAEALGSASELVPARDEAFDHYENRLDKLKARIIGTLRRTGQR